MKRTVLLLALLAAVGGQKALAQAWVTSIDTLYNEEASYAVNLPDHSIVFAGSQCLYPLADPCTRMVVGRLSADGQPVWIRNDVELGLTRGVKRWGNRLCVVADNNTSILQFFWQDQALVFDFEGNLLLQHPIGQNHDYFADFDRALNGDFFFAGYSSDLQRPILVRTDSLFNTLWEATTDSVDATRSMFVAAQPDGGAHVWLANGFDIDLKKFDGSGNLLFENTDAPPSFSSSIAQYFPVSDGGLVGIQGSFGNDDLKIARFDSDGNVSLEATLAGSSAFNNFNLDLVELASGDLLIAQSVKDNQQAIFLYSADGHFKGRQDWQKPTGKQFFLHNALATSDGGLLISGSSLADFSDPLFTGTDSLYFVKWGNVPIASYTNLLEGRLFVDADAGCQFDSADAAAAGRLVVANNGVENYFGMADSSGHYQIHLPTGQFMLVVSAPSSLYEPCGVASISLASTDTANVDLGLKKLTSCPYLTADLTIPRLRRCFNNPASVHVCNLGTTAADSAHLDLTLDPYLTLVNATAPFTALGGNAFRFDLGKVDVFECRDIGLTIHVNCDSTVVGQVHCVEAHIFPDSLCLPPAASWSGASIEVDAQCSGDSIHFTITNTGSAATTVPCDFIVIEDDVILFEGQQPLGPGQTVQLSYAAGGHFWRLEASQEPGHPGTSMPSISAQGCGGWWPGSFAFWTAFPNDDGNPAVDIDCVANTGSYDPNEKTSSPEGIENEHFIHKNQDIEYTIHFQNTGTDTAFKVVVLDTLDQNLRPETLRPGGASHPFSWEIYGPGILKMTFENIGLPDSTTNLAGSQGWFSYSISQKEGLVDGSKIRNRAAIFFDFNRPVLTNRTLHTIGSDFLTVKTWISERPDARLTVYPNPTSGEATFLLTGVGEGERLRLEVFDLAGRVVLSKNFKGGASTVGREGLSGGLYFFKITGEGGRAVGAGKLVIE